jgi:hypothetical protein
MIRARDVASLAGLGKLEDREYSCGSELWSVLVARQIGALFKKNEAFTDDDRCTAAAQKNFERGETICRITNRRLDWYYLHPDRLDPELGKLIQSMEQDIAYLLGDTEDFLSAMPSLVRLTNGATEDRSRKRSLPFLKVSGKLRGPRAAIPHIANLLSEMGVDLSSCKYDIVNNNVIDVVLKNWETHRTIAKEPSSILPFQLALDAWFKSKLRRWGIDLSSQAKNQEAARRGSIDGTIATVDLVMASDTCSYNAVALTTPTEWFKLLCSFRSSSYKAPWGEGEYAKFSSMGNGYTFTLETLIFTAACRAVGSRQYAVYGDDIALETELVPQLVRLLRFLGFSVNDAKSFYHPDSRFRESCGCDYYKGEFITPFYLRSCPKETDRAGMSHALNGLISAALCPGPVWDWAYTEVQRLKLRLVPWNEDPRSGVFITPNRAWRSGKLSTDRRRTVGGRPNAMFGQPVFRGYTTVQDSRKTNGWRSLFLWFLNKSQTSSHPLCEVPKRTGVYLLYAAKLRELELYGPAATVVSSTAVRSRYVHSTCRFNPSIVTATPAHLFLWDEVVGGLLARKP